MFLNRFSRYYLLIVIFLATIVFGPPAPAQTTEQIDPPLLSDIHTLRKQFDEHALLWINRHPEYPFYAQFKQFIEERKLGVLDAHTSSDWIQHCDAAQDLQGKSILRILDELRTPEPKISIVDFCTLLKGGEFSKELSLRLMVNLAQLQKPPPSPGLSPYLSAALDLASEVGVRRYLVETNLLAGLYLYKLGDDLQTLRFTAKAKELADSTTPESLLHVAYSVSGSAHMVLGHNNAARADFLRVLEFCLRTNLLAEYWTVQSRIAQLELQQGSFLEAESLYSKVYEAAQTTKAEKDLALLGLALCEFNSGRYGTALVKVKPLIIDETVSPRVRAQAFFTCGLVHYRTGHLEVAEQELNRALQSGPEKAGPILLQLASLYWDKGDFNSSADAYRRYFLLEQGQKSGVMSPATVERIYNLWRCGQFIEAMNHFEQELSGGPPSETGARLLWQTGASFAKLGKEQNAIRSFKAALNQAKLLQGPSKVPFIVDSLFELAQLHSTVDDFDSSEELLKLYESRGSLTPGGVQKLLLLIGEARWLEGKREEALGDFRSAYEIERTRLMRDLANGGEQLALLHSTFDGKTENKLVFALKSLKRFTEAAEVLDDSRGRLLAMQADLVEKANSSEGGKQIISRIRELSLEVGESDGAQSQTVAAKITELQTQLVSLVHPPALPRLGAKLSDSNSAVLRYVWLSDGLNCLVSSHGKTDVFVLAAPVERNQILEQTEQFRKLVSNRNSSLPACRQAGQQLYAKLVSPLALSNATDLQISQSDLEFLPFEALTDGAGKYLCEKYIVSYGAANLRASQGKRGIDPSKCLVVGGVDFTGVRVPFGRPNDGWTPLAGSQEEAKIVAAFLGTGVLTGKDATKQEVLARLRNAQIVHLATHGYFLPSSKKGQSPGHLLANLTGTTALDQLVETSIHGILARSGIVLALNKDGTGGLFTGLDLAEENLQECKLVVLSACESGLGVPGLENASIGLRRTLSKCGAQAIVSSLWKVSDGCSVAFMEQFYRKLMAGSTVSDALNDARRSLIDGEVEPNYRHPFYWASFSCYGDPSVRIVGGN